MSTKWQCVSCKAMFDEHAVAHMRCFRHKTLVCGPCFEQIPNQEETLKGFRNSPCGVSEGKEETKAQADATAQLGMIMIDLRDLPPAAREIIVGRFLHLHAQNEASPPQ